MNKVFENYSKYYNLLYQDKNYPEETTYILNLIKKFAPDAAKILELGCGTGKHAKLLEQNGFDILGVDMSETMLEEAQKMGVNCQLGDVRFFRCKKKFDVILSLFHVVSYQITDEDILNIFKTAASHLEKNGVFIFDLWYKSAVLAQIPEKRVKEMENDEIEVIRYCSPNHIIEKSIVEVFYDIEIFDKLNKKTEKINEKHSMRYFSEDEIKNYAAQNDINIIHFEEWLTGKKPDETTWGVCFVGIKNA